MLVGDVERLPNGLDAGRVTLYGGQILRTVRDHKAKLCMGGKVENRFAMPPLCQVMDGQKVYSQLFSVAARSGYLGVIGYSYRPHNPRSTGFGELRLEKYEAFEDMTAYQSARLTQNAMYKVQIEFVGDPILSDPEFLEKMQPQPLSKAIQRETADMLGQVTLCNYRPYTGSRPFVNNPFVAEQLRGLYDARINVTPA